MGLLCRSYRDAGSDQASVKLFAFAIVNPCMLFFNPTELCAVLFDPFFTVVGALQLNSGIEIDHLDDRYIT